LIKQFRKRDLQKAGGGLILLLEEEKMKGLQRKRIVIQEGAGLFLQSRRGTKESENRERLED